MLRRPRVSELQSLRSKRSGGREVVRFTTKSRQGQMHFFFLCQLFRLSTLHMSSASIYASSHSQRPSLSSQTKMQRAAVSRDGKIAWGSHFASCHGERVPATIRLVTKEGEGEAVEADHVAFSAFGVRRPGGKASHSAGDHVALAFNASDSFATVLVRCDTWAVQWAVEKVGCLADAATTHLAALCANIVCGVAQPVKGTSSPSSAQCIFVASRLDVPVQSRKENKEWRQFMAPPRRVATELEEEGVAAIAAFDKNTLLVLTLAGTLALVHLDVRALKGQPSSSTAFATVERLSCKVSKPIRSARMAVFNDEKEHAFVAVYAAPAKKVEVVQLPQVAAADKTARPPRSAVAATVLSVTTSIPVEDVCFAGPFHLALTCARAKENLQFIGLVPGAGAVEAMPFDALTVPRVPFSTFYDDLAEELVVVASSSSSHDSAAFVAMPNAQKIASLIETTLSLAAGPCSQTSLLRAAWSLVVNPFRHYGPRTRHHDANAEGESGADAEEEDLQVLQDTGARAGGRWSPVTLCYALATLQSTSRHTRVAVFAVETAGFLHTRLIKQWHNATAGLKMILASAAATHTAALALPWNPRHIRRALRLLSQRELSALLHRVATTIAASEQVSSPVWYADATTTAVEVALHTITLARQMGAPLGPEDVRTVAVILRAARESGHELLRYASRMELLMESQLQQRAMSRVLDRRTPAEASGGASEVAAQSLEGNFYGIAAELQTERTLHTRYAANAWAQHLAAHKTQYQAEAEGAARLLAAALSQSPAEAERALSDWRRLGAAPHQDPLLDQFERALL